MMIEGWRQGRPTTQLLLAAVFACALLLRLAIPDGWRPVQTAQGWRLTICTGTGPLDAAPTMTMAHGGHKMPAGDHQKAGVCPFTALGLAMVEPLVPPFAFVPPILAAAPALFHEMVAIGRGLAAPPPPATGPPAIA